MSASTPTPTPPGDDAPGGLLSLYQPHQKIYPRSVDGLFSRLRWVMVWITQLAFYLTPWLMWNHRPAVLFELTTRRFYIFGLVLYPQDLIYLTALLVISAYGLFLFTAIAGRLWCGYACPQTVYTEIFLWVERKIEGDRQRQLKLAAAPWSAEKIARRTAKHLSWGLIALWTGFTFVGYFTPIRTLSAELAAGALGAWEMFWVLFYGFATYGNAGFMREQVCKYMCPYARFQGAMFDPDTLIITYEAQRGEPRGPRSKKADPKALGLGDCVDCNLCVQVCPTGIDIRKGQQYECIGCAACIDVCNTVMDKVGYPRGLVRYDTLNGLQQGLPPSRIWRRLLRPRVMVYLGIMAAVLALLGTSLALRPPFRVDVLRDRSALARQVEDGWVENVYRLQVMNATEGPQHYRIAADGLPGLVLSTPAELDVAPAEARWVNVALRVPAGTAQSLPPGARPVLFHVERAAGPQGAAWTVDEKTTFILPR